MCVRWCEREILSDRHQDSATHADEGGGDSYQQETKGNVWHCIPR
jgi:hypothetical protein